MSSKNPSKVEKKDMIQIKKAEIFFNSRTALQKTLKKQGNKQTNTQINKSTGSREWYQMETWIYMEAYEMCHIW